MPKRYPNRTIQRSKDPDLTLSERLNIAFLATFIYAFSILIWIPIIIGFWGYLSWDDSGEMLLLINPDRGSTFIGILLLLSSITGIIGFHLKPKQLVSFFSIVWLTTPKDSKANVTLIQFSGLTLLCLGILNLLVLFIP